MAATPLSESVITDTESDLYKGVENGAFDELELHNAKDVFATDNGALHPHYDNSECTLLMNETEKKACCTGDGTVGQDTLQPMLRVINTFLLMLISVLIASGHGVYDAQPFRVGVGADWLQPQKLSVFYKNENQSATTAIFTEQTAAPQFLSLIVTTLMTTFSALLLLMWALNRVPRKALVISI